MGGTFTAPFKENTVGILKNLSDKEITITLKLKGQYQLFKK